MYLLQGFGFLEVEQRDVLGDEDLALRD